MTAAEAHPGRSPLWRRFRNLLALAAAVAVVLLAFTTPLRVVAVPMILALFPATLLVPTQRRLRQRGVPAALAAALLTATMVTGLVVAGGLAIPILVQELPRLASSLAAGLRDIMGTIDRMPLGVEVGGIDALIERGGGLVFAQAADGQAADALVVAGEVVAGLVLFLVLLFFYLKDGARIATGLQGAMPARWRPHAQELGQRVWRTLRAFVRGQLLVAFVDGVFIGIGLFLIGVPLALPLALLVFLGGLLPIIGAVATGALAVLVALADGGFWPALAVLALVVAVQQAESNILQPVVMGRLTALHPLLVILSITVGWLALGVLGAFLAVPIAACTARAFDYLRETASLWRQETAEPSPGSTRQTSPSAEASMP